MSRAPRYDRAVDPRARWRPFRWPVDLPVTVTEPASCPLDARVVELSATGCRIHAGWRLRPGDMVTLTLPGMAAIRGTIVWAHEWQAAIAFARPLHGAVVRHLAGLSGPRRGDPPSPFDPAVARG